MGTSGRWATSGGLVNFMRGQLGKPIPSPVVLGQVTEKFRDAVKAEAERQQIRVYQFTTKSGKTTWPTGRPARECSLNTTEFPWQVVPAEPRSKGTWIGTHSEASPSKSATRDRDNRRILLLPDPGRGNHRPRTHACYSQPKPAPRVSHIG